MWLVLHAAPVSSQSPTVQDLISQSNSLLHSTSTNKPVVSCIRLDGRCVFKVAFARSELSQRANEIQYRLNEIKESYIQQENAKLQVSSKVSDNNNNIYFVS